MIYFQDPCADVAWDETGSVVMLEWKKFASLEKMQLALNKCLELLQQKKANRLLANSSNMAPFNKESADWIAENWTPRAITGGLKYMAYLVPKSAVTRLTFEHVKSDHFKHASYESAIFDSMEAAKAWLATCK